MTLDDLEKLCKERLSYTPYNELHKEDKLILNIIEELKELREQKRKSEMEVIS